MGGRVHKVVQEVLADLKKKTHYHLTWSRVGKFPHSSCWPRSRCDGGCGPGQMHNVSQENNLSSFDNSNFKGNYLIVNHPLVFSSKLQRHLLGDSDDHIQVLTTIFEIGYFIHDLQYCFAARE